MRLKIKKLYKDRHESVERNKKGELKLIETDTLRGRLEVYRNEADPLGGLADTCDHKLALGCMLPVWKRKFPECEVCL